MKILQFLKKFLQRIRNLINSHEGSKGEQELKDKPFFISLQNDGIYINGKKIVGQKSKLQAEVIKILVEHYKDEISFGSSYFPISKICSMLKKAGIDSYNLESQVHISIYRIRKAANKVGIPQGIIESSKWKGYRLGDQVFIKRNKQV